MFTEKDEAFIREIRTDYKFKWLEQILKDVIRESINELRYEDKELRDLEIKLKENEKQKAPAPKPLSIPQLAERYGVSKATVHNWRNQKLITGFKMGKGRFFHLEEVEKNLTQYRYLDRLESQGLIQPRKRIKLD
jgi:transcriptional antiterminator